MVNCPKCGSELASDGICDLCYLVDEIFRECGSETVSDLRRGLEKLGGEKA